MIRDSKDPDATYQPYAKTNKELTDLFTVSKQNYTYKGVDIYAIKVGYMITFSFGGTATETIDTSTDILSGVEAMRAGVSAGISGLIANLASALWFRSSYQEVLRFTNRSLQSGETPMGTFTYISANSLPLT
jgi:hypothetical protein